MAGFAGIARFGAVHPDGIARTHQAPAVDKDAVTGADAAADFDVGAGNDALAAAGFVTGEDVDVAFFMQVGGFAGKEDVGGNLSAFIHRVGDGVGNGAAFTVGRQADVRLQVDENELGVFGGGGFVGHVMPPGGGFQERVLLRRRQWSSGVRR